MKLKTFRKFLKLGVDRGNPFTEEHEWMYNLINSYGDIDKDLVYSLFNETSDMIAIRQEFIITILTNTEKYYDIKKFKDVHASIQDVIDLWRKDPTGKQESAAWSAARSVAESAARSVAESAARSADAADAAAYATYVAAYAADAAVYAAAYAAAYAARSAARSVAESAARSADAADAAAYAAAYAADAAAYAADAAAYAAARSVAEKEQQYLIMSVIRKYTK